MSDLISVIVIDEKDSMFRERCLNAIKRQTYTETETIVITEETCKAVMEACCKAGGEYLFFCSVTSVIQDNTLEELHAMTQKSDGDVLACADIYTKDSGTDYQRYAGDISLYGKLFRKDRLTELRLMTEETDLLWRYEMLLKYMAGDLELVCAPQAIVYETSPQGLEVEEACRDNILERLYEKLAAIAPETEEVGPAAEKRLDIQKKAGLEREEPVTEDRRIKYSYGFYEDQKGRTACLLVKKEYPIEHEVQQEVVCVPVPLEELNGAVLSEYMIQRFAQGSLGLKTIVKAMAAWLKYKLGAGGTHE